MNKKSLTVRDLINAGLFSVLTFIVTFLTGMIGFIPILMPFIPLATGITTGPVNMLYATRIKKAGMLVIQQFLIGFVFLLTGHGFWIVLTSVLCAIVAEFVLAKGGYKSINAARWAFCITSIGVLGSFIPIFIGREQYIQYLIDSGYGKEYAHKMMAALPTWSLLPVMIGAVIGAYIGCSIGIVILKKHFVKAGMVQGE